MKILMLTPYLPYPPSSGGQIRTLNLLKYLAKKHKITLVCLYKNDDEKKYARQLGPYCTNLYLCKRASHPWQPEKMLKAVFSALPFLIVRNYSQEAQDTVSQLLKTEHFDVIHAETFYIMPHIPQTQIPILLVEQTIEYKVYAHFVSTLPLPLKLALSIDIFKLKYWEKYYWRKANLVAPVSDADKDEMKKILPIVSPVVIPNGAGDEMFYHPRTSQNSPAKLLFMGNFSWLQNLEAAVWLIHDLFPILQVTHPDITLQIAGQNCEKLSKNKKKGVSIIQLSQNSSDEVRKLYREATIFVAPIFGPGGTRLKILGSMASGLPVISTPTGLEGLHTEPGIHALTAETPDQFAQAVSRLLNDQQLYSNLSRRAFDHVSTHFSWHSIADSLDIAYRKITTHV